MSLQPACSTILSSSTLGVTSACLVHDNRRHTALVALVHTYCWSCNGRGSRYMSCSCFYDTLFEELFLLLWGCLQLMPQELSHLVKKATCSAGILLLRFISCLLKMFWCLQSPQLGNIQVRCWHRSALSGARPIALCPETAAIIHPIPKVACRGQARPIVPLSSVAQTLAFEQASSNLSQAW